MVPGEHVVPKSRESTLRIRSLGIVALFGSVSVVYPAVSPALAQESEIRFAAAVHVSTARLKLPHVEPHLAEDPTDPDNLLAVSIGLS